MLFRSPADFERFARPASRMVFDGLADLGVPRIHFGVGTGELLGQMHAAGADVVGVDWRIPLDVAWQRIGHDCSVQGNLDPTVLLSDPDVIRAEVGRLLNSVSGRPGHIFNLGHGIHKETPVENAIALVQAVKDLSQR